MGHKWMWSQTLGGLPPEDFLASVDPLLAGMRERLGGRYGTSEKIAGELSGEWARRLGLRAGIPIPVGALDAHALDVHKAGPVIPKLWEIALAGLLPIKRGIDMG